MRPRSGAARMQSIHEGPRHAFRKIHDFAQTWIEILELESQPDGVHLTVEKQLMDDARGDVDRNRESDPLSTAVDCGIDADQLAFGIQ